MTELNAVMCVWNEADIIEASVRHAFAQGCNHVFVIDNGSTDDTVARAKAAGAEIALCFESKYFDEIQKISFLNHVVRQYNCKNNDASVWWLYLDADEFPDTNNGLTLAAFVNRLDDSVMAVHGVMHNHTPSHLPFYMLGFHPADFMPLVSTAGYEKIPLVRYVKGRQHLYSCGGAHTLDTNGESILLAKNAIHIHHFQTRRPEVTRQRLKKLLAKRKDGTRRVDWMDKHAGNQSQTSKIKSAYHNRLQKSMKAFKVDWPTLLTYSPNYDFRNLKRWYSPEQIVLDDCLDTRDRLLFLGIYGKYLGYYDSALCHFNDLLPLCDSHIYAYVFANIADCMMADDMDEAKKMLFPLLKHNDTELRLYVSHLLETCEPAKQHATQQTGGKLKIERYCSALEPATMQACLVLEQAIDNMLAQNQKIQFL